jgi:competence protein ComEA
MNFLSKFGFTYRERILIAVLLCALLAGIIISAVKHRITYSESQTLSDRDSIAINQLQQFAARASNDTSVPKSQKVDKPTIPASQLIDINTADATQLEELPGIGPKLAQRIIEHREKYGLFRSIDSLSDVQGIGEKRLNKIRDLITLSIP